jgi:four helix bundle protein
MNHDSIESLRVYSLAKQLNIQAYPILKGIRDFSYRDQLTRSCLSVASNVAEGYGRYGRRSFPVFLSYSLGSAYEFRVQMEIAESVGIVSTDQTKPLLQMINQWIPMAINLMKSLNHPQ